MNFSENKTIGNRFERRAMSPSRNREIEVAQAGLRRAYAHEHESMEGTRRENRRNLVQVLVNLITFWMR